MLYKKVVHFLTQDITNHLVELLNVNDDPECNKDICQILINSKRPLSEKQEKDLNDLLNKSSTEHLLNLLIEKGNTKYWRSRKYNFFN